MKFDNKYFSTFQFTSEQMLRNLNNVLKDLDIAKRDVIPEVQ